MTIIRHFPLLLLGIVWGCQEPVLVQDKPERYQAILNRAISENNLRGVSAAISAPAGEWAGTAGYSGIDVPVDANMRFAIGSITKNLVAALVLKLEEEGLLHIDDSLGQYLPSFANIDDEITIKQLLSHSSGIADYTDSPKFIKMIIDSPSITFSPEDIISIVTEPVFTAGEKFSYSNTNFILLGMIIETVTGDTFHSQLKTRLLNPNGLSVFYMAIREDVPGDIAHPWSDILGNGLEDIFTIPRESLYTAAWTAGGMFSTAAELNRWTGMLFSGEILTEESTKKMTEFASLSNASGPRVTGYGLGTMRYLSAREWVGHSGDIFGFGSLSLFSRQDGIAITVLFNQDTADNLRVEVIDSLFEVAMTGTNNE